VRQLPGGITMLDARRDLCIKSIYYRHNPGVRFGWQKNQKFCSQSERPVARSEHLKH
jgi:hypothetical protein